MQMLMLLHLWQRQQQDQEEGHVRDARNNDDVTTTTFSQTGLEFRGLCFLRHTP